MAGALESVARRPAGHLRVEVFRNGELIELYEGPNLVVAGADQIAMAALVGTGGPVNQIGFGSGSVPAVAGNTALSNPYVKALDSRTATAGVATFGFSLSGVTAGVTGMTLWEFGLLTAAGALYARKVRSSGLVMTADISLQGTWIISFPAGA